MPFITEGMKTATMTNVIKIHIRPDCIYVISYPGPSPTEVTEVPSRNRKIARFLN